MIVASTIVPCRISKPRSSSIALTSSNRPLVRSCRSNQCRKCKTVVASGTGSRFGGFKQSSQHLDEGIAMGTLKRRSDQAGRGILCSPGRPGVARREDRRRFWTAIAAGLTSEDAARRAGVSPAVGTRWFREAGGMPSAALAPSSKPLCGRYLSFAEREEIALCRAQGQGVREVARRLGRAASTISRELRRNAATRGGGLDYRATAAQWHAERAAGRPKPAKLVTNAALQTYVQDRLAGVVATSGGAALCGPVVPWKGRRQGRRKNRQWPGRGARSRLPGGCGSTFPAMRRCASATRPSTRHYTCRAEARCGAS